MRSGTEIVGTRQAFEVVFYESQAAKVAAYRVLLVEAMSGVAHTSPEMTSDQRNYNRVVRELRAVKTEALRRAVSIFQ